MKRVAHLTVVLLSLFLSVGVWAGVPSNVPVIDDVALQKFLKSLADHLNTLECLTADPNGSVLGTHGELKCANFGGANYICMNTGTGPSKGTAWTCLNITNPVSGISGSGADTQVAYWTGASSIAGDEGFTFTSGTNLVNINEATDGDSILLRLDNDQTNTASSTNETAQMRFGFGSDTDVARLIVSKYVDFTDNNSSDAGMIFQVDKDNVSTELLRLNGNRGTVGVGGVTNPASILTVNGGASIGSSYTGTASPTDGLIVESQIGIGTSSPSTTQRLHVKDTGGFGGAALRAFIDGPSTFDAPAGIDVGWAGATYGTWQIYQNSAANNYGAYSDFSELDHRYIRTDRPGYLAFRNGNRTSVSGEDPHSIFFDHSLTLSSGATIGTQRTYIFEAPTLNGVAGGATETCTNCATVYIENAPSGSDITITNPYALWVDDGAVRFDGAATFGSITVTSTTASGDYTIQKADPTLIYDVTTATDTDFWAGVQDDAGGDDDDKYQIGDGTTPGSNIHLTIDTDGDVGIGNTDPAANFVVDFPAAQTIAAGNTVAADACGSIKLISSAGAVTTDTTNTFTAPAASNKGCLLHVCNSGANNITLDNNANFKSPAGADVVMTPDDCIVVGSTGASGVWYAMTALVAN